MANDDAVRNQKVFIRLDSLMSINTELNRCRAISEENRKAGKFDIGINSRMAGIQWVLDTLQLPRAGN